MNEIVLDVLRRRLSSAGVTEVIPFGGGASSITFTGVRDERDVVIKVAPAGVKPVANRDVLRQARVIKALAGTSVPVPEVLWEDDALPPLFVMSRVEGECVEPLFSGVTDDTPLPDVTERYRNASRVMAAVHRLLPGDIGLGDEPVLEPVAEVHRWCNALRTVDPALVPGWQDVPEALLRSVPTALRPSVIHGDFRLGNMLAVGAQIRAVIDWEIWAVGDPRIDLGWFLINSDPGTYQRVPEAAGIAPPSDELARIYADELGGGPAVLDDLSWFRALACFKSTATWSLIIKHNRRKRSPRAELEAMVPVLPRLLARARALLDQPD
ncbi:acyl-CoA dehydrogenase [Mycobacterium intermedium]|uniref:Acyl-CoA dehydrogenase n=1 Tax=Mycobacterium intermedium TaxID=28445 RepID=A0A1E3S9L3_MYCIE|nr:phosphotransferase family protein [Mycobacterium intermedium]MCV6966595.1 phosphotransferase family protein [Mycobacterium intermedium]ODQ98784.1 acyl-CoA dehydrogenase [Mycobacterium intermedium]OPE49853.1 acyl-CoA dehydrogenase [Mycobacterium intermedium]ORB04679.1 acyl-CoA dehydrogenase [Mycobacterium intermedium]